MDRRRGRQSTFPIGFPSKVSQSETGTKDQRTPFACNVPTVFPEEAKKRVSSWQSLPKVMIRKAFIEIGIGFPTNMVGKEVNVRNRLGS